MSMPKVSIVVPIYNVQQYLRQCLDSIVNQTLQDIEIICVNDGSTDRSPDIIREYQAADSRIVVIDKANTGYGNSMNRGFDIAKGEYIGIVESDDYVEPNMFEKLYTMAKKDSLDVIKSSFYFYYSRPVEKNMKQNIASRIMCSRVLCPREDFKAPLEMSEFFNIKPTIWSAIYRKDFIRENNIRFNETPGASFQDASFNFKVWACANRVRLTNDAYLHYRQDNESSSVNSKGKIFCVCDEYEEMEKFLKSRPELSNELEYVKNRIKFDTYMWNYQRLMPKFKYLFLERAATEFREDMEGARLDRRYFEDYKWDDLMLLIDDPIEFHESFARKHHISKDVYKKLYMDMKNSKSFKIGRLITFLPRKLRGGVWCIRDHGLLYTIVLFFRKLGIVK